MVKYVILQPLQPQTVLAVYPCTAFRWTSLRAHGIRMLDPDIEWQETIVSRLVVINSKMVQFGPAYHELGEPETDESL